VLDCIYLYLLLLSLLDYNTKGMPCLKMFGLDPFFRFNKTLTFQLLPICQLTGRNIAKVITLEKLATSFGDQNSDGQPNEQSQNSPVHILGS